MDERPNALSIAGGLVQDGLASFIAKHGSNAEVIRLPRGEFMLRAGDNVFSSLDPTAPVRRIKLGPGRELYEHQNYIISTVGLDPKTGEVAPGVNDMGRAFSSHWEMTRPPIDFQIEGVRAALRKARPSFEMPGPPYYIKQEDIPFFEAEGVHYLDGNEPSVLYDAMDYVSNISHFNTLRGHQQFGHTFPNMKPRNLSTSWDRGRGLVGSGPPPDDYEPYLELLRKGYSMIEIPAFQHVPFEDVLTYAEKQRGGVVMSQLADHSRQINAFRGTKQIVAHPSQLIPSEIDYGGELAVIPTYGLGSRKEWSPATEFVVPWLNEGPEPPRTLFRLYEANYPNEAWAQHSLDNGFYAITPDRNPRPRLDHF